MQYSKQHIKSEIQKHRDNDNRTFNPFHVTDFLFCQTLKKKSTTNINIEKQINKYWDSDNENRKTNRENLLQLLG